MKDTHLLAGPNDIDLEPEGFELGQAVAEQREPAALTGRMQPATSEGMAVEHLTAFHQSLSFC
jgi:hypothetical protein